MSKENFLDSGLVKESDIDPSFRKIIVAQHLGMGDLVSLEPISRYLKKRYPNSNILWTCPKKFRELVDTNPYIDKALEIDSLLDWHKNIKPKIKNNNYIVFDLTGFSKLKINFLNYYYFGSLLESFSLSANLPKICEQPNIYINEDVVKKVDKFNLPEKFVVIHRFSSNFARSLYSNNWDIFLNYIIEKYNFKIIEIGGKDIQSILKPNIHNTYYFDLRGILSVLETAEVIRRASYFIGVDSGPSHLANAVKTKGVIILGVWLGKFKKHIPYSGFYRDLNNVRYARNFNGPVDDISIETIFKAFNSLVNNLESNDEINPYDFKSNKLIENFLNSSDNFILYGASGGGLLYKILLNKLGKDVICFIDSDLKKDNTFLENTPVFHHSKLNDNFLKNKKIIISSISYWQEISKILEKNYNKKVFVDYI